MDNLFLLIVLIVLPSKFVDIATEDLIKKEFSTNEQLLAQYPDKKLPQLKRDEFRKTMQENASRVRELIINSLKPLFLVLISAVLLAYLIRFSGVIIPSSALFLLRLFSITIIFWSVLGKLGWDMQTWSGNTLPEVMHKTWTQSLYLLGTFIVIFVTYLEFLKKS